MPEQVTVQQLTAAMTEGGIVLVDVREDDEWDEGHIPGAVHIAMGTIPSFLDQLPTDGSLYVICEVGGRSGRVAQYLESQGIPATNVAGGMDHYRQLGGPIET